MVAIRLRVEMLRLMSNSNDLCFQFVGQMLEQQIFFQFLPSSSLQTSTIQHGYQEAQYANQVKPTCSGC